MNKITDFEKWKECVEFNPKKVKYSLEDLFMAYVGNMEMYHSSAMIEARNTLNRELNY